MTILKFGVKLKCILDRSKKIMEKYKNMNKTDRKNKTNLVMKWPDLGKLFTIKDLMAINPDFIEITLRVRLDNAIKKSKTVAVIGYKNVGKGRPTMVLSMNPITQQLLDSAYATDIQPPEIRPTVTMMDVTTPISTAENIIVDIPTDVNVAKTISAVSV